MGWPSLRMTASPLGFFAVPAAVVPRTSGGASLKFECWAFLYSAVVSYWVRACVSRLMAPRVAPGTTPTLRLLPLLRSRQPFRRPPLPARRLSPPRRRPSFEPLPQEPTVQMQLRQELLTLSLA